MSQPRETRSNAFSKSRHLVITREFDRVFAARKSASDAILIVYAAPNGLPSSRLGLSIGRRAGNAVERNRLKRIVREAFRTGGGSVAPGFDFVVVARKTPCKTPSDAIKSSFVRLAAQAAKRWQ